MVFSSSRISAMKRLGRAATVSRPFLRRWVQLTARLRWARVTPTYIRRRSSSKRCKMPSLMGPSLLPEFDSLSPSLKGSRPSFTPTSITCGHSKPLEACNVDKVTTFWSFSRSLKVEIKEMVCATSSKLLLSVLCAPVASSISPPQRPAIQSQNSSTLVQRAAETFSLSSPSYKCCS